MLHPPRFSCRVLVSPALSYIKNIYNIYGLSSIKTILFFVTATAFADPTPTIESLKAALSSENYRRDNNGDVYLNNQKIELIAGENRFIASGMRGRINTFKTEIETTLNTIVQEMKDFEKTYRTCNLAPGTIAWHIHKRHQAIANFANSKKDQALGQAHGCINRENSARNNSYCTAYWLGEAEGLKQTADSFTTTSEQNRNIAVQWGVSNDQQGVLPANCNTENAEDNSCGSQSCRPGTTCQAGQCIPNNQCSAIRYYNDKANRCTLCKCNGQPHQCNVPCEGECFPEGKCQGIACTSADADSVCTGQGQTCQNGKCLCDPSLCPDGKTCSPQANRCTLCRCKNKETPPKQLGAILQCHEKCQPSGGPSKCSANAENCVCPLNSKNCSCASNNQCTSPQTCSNNGICENPTTPRTPAQEPEPEPEPASCSADNPCSRGQYCYNGVCTKICEDGSDCRETRTCGPAVTPNTPTSIEDRNIKVCKICKCSDGTNKNCSEKCSDGKCPLGSTTCECTDDTQCQDFRHCNTIGEKPDGSDKKICTFCKCGDRPHRCNVACPPPAECTPRDKCQSRTCTSANADSVCRQGQVCSNGKCICVNSNCPAWQTCREDLNYCSLCLCNGRNHKCNEKCPASDGTNKCLAESRNCVCAGNDECQGGQTCQDVDSGIKMCKSQ